MRSSGLSFLLHLLPGGQRLELLPAKGQHRRTPARQLRSPSAVDPDHRLAFHTEPPLRELSESPEELLAARAAVKLELPRITLLTIPHHGPPPCGILAYRQVSAICRARHYYDDPQLLP